MNLIPDIEADSEIIIVYDGECPFCTAYISVVRLKANFRKVALVNAREGGKIIEEIKNVPLDLDEGMVVRIGDKYFHGHECMWLLSLLASDNGSINRLFAWIFKSAFRAKLLYPLLRLGRNFVLYLLGKNKINA